MAGIIPFLEGVGSAVEGAYGLGSAVLDEGAAATGAAGGLYTAARAADYVNPSSWRNFAEGRHERPPATPPRPKRTRRDPPPRPPRPTRPPMANHRVISRPEFFHWLPTTSRKRIARRQRSRWKTRHFRKSSFYRKWHSARKIQRAFRRNYFRKPKSSSFVKYAKYTRPVYVQPRPYWNHDFTKLIYPRPVLDSKIGEPYGKLRRLKHRAGRVWSRRRKYAYLR